MGAGGQQPPRPRLNARPHAAPEDNGPKPARLNPVVFGGGDPQRELPGPPPESDNGRRCHADAERVGWGSPRLKNRARRRFLSAPVSK